MLTKNSTIFHVERTYQAILEKDPHNSKEQTIEFLRELLENIEWKAENPIGEFFNYHPEIFTLLPLESTADLGILMPKEAENAFQKALTKYQQSATYPAVKLLNRPAQEIVSVAGLAILSPLSPAEVQTLSEQQHKSKALDSVLHDLSTLGEAIHAEDRKLLKKPQLQAIMKGMINAAGQGYTPQTHPDFEARIRRAINPGVRGAFSRKQSTLFSDSKDEKTQSKAKWYDQIVNEITGKGKSSAAPSRSARPST